MQLKVYGYPINPILYIYISCAIVYLIVCMTKRSVIISILLFGKNARKRSSQRNYSKGRQVVRDLGDIEALLANQKQRGEQM